MDIESGLPPTELKTTLAIASNVRKGRKVFLGCCKGVNSDKSVTVAPKLMVDMVALAGCEFCFHF